MEKLDVLKQGRPLDCDLKVKLYYDILDDLQIAYQRLDLKALSLNEDIKRIDDILETRAIKNLLFRTLSKRNPRYFMIILFSDERFDTHAFRNKYQLPKIEMVLEDELKSLLHTHSEAVSIIELFHDVENQINLYIQEDVLKQTYFRFHPNDEDTLLCIKTKDLMETLLPFLHHTCHIF